MTQTCILYGEDAEHLITIWQQVVTTTTTTTISATANQTYAILQNQVHSYCADASYSSVTSDTLAACKSRCTNEPACNFISYWENPRTSWCHLTTTCDSSHSEDSLHLVTIWEKAQAYEDENAAAIQEVQHFARQKRKRNKKKRRAVTPQQRLRTKTISAGA